MIVVFLSRPQKFAYTRPKSDGARGQKMTHLGDIRKEDKVANGDDGLLIEHIELLRDGCRQEAATEDGRAGLGDQARVRRQLVYDLSRAFRGRGRI